MQTLTPALSAALALFLRLRRGRGPLASGLLSALFGAAVFAALNAAAPWLREAAFFAAYVALAAAGLRPFIEAAPDARSRSLRYFAGLTLAILLVLALDGWLYG
ncbi:hypothetical protein [Oceanithermus profundus]